MRLTAQDVPPLLEGIPDDSWVAISMEEKKVITYAETLEEVLRVSRSQGVEHPFVVKAPLYRSHIAF